MHIIIVKKTVKHFRRPEKDKNGIIMMRCGVSELAMKL
jgi:hypothetical protein